MQVGDNFVVLVSHSQEFNGPKKKKTKLFIIELVWMEWI